MIPKAFFPAFAFVLWASLTDAALPTPVNRDSVPAGTVGLKTADTALLRNIPAAQQSLVATWVTRLQAYYLSVRNSQNVYLGFCAELLSRNNLPEELKLICLIESHMNPDAVSEDGATGIWQLMPEVAAENKLSLTPYDERKDIYKSSHVAVKLIKDLYKKYSDKLMVVAAYNCGPGRVDGLMGGSSKGYWAIHNSLPAETQNHVLKYLAAVSVFYDLPLTKPDVKPLVSQDAASFTRPVKAKNGGSVSLRITSSFRAPPIIKYIGISPAAFTSLNPGMEAAMARQGYYELKLPESFMLRFLAQKSQILRSSLAADTTR